MTTLTLNRMASAGCLVVTLLLQIACSSSAGEVAARPHGDDDMIMPGASHSSGASFTDQCSVGQQRTCSFHLPEHNGVRPCVIGVQTCVDRSWGRCMEGTLGDAQAPTAEPTPSVDPGSPIEETDANVPAQTDAGAPMEGPQDSLQSP